jgi:uncharacterized RDD family membrane protein YckC
MSARAERITTEIQKEETEIVSGFDAEKFRAPFALRCGALLIDYIILIAAPVVSLLIANRMGESGLKLLNSQISNAGWLVFILLAVTNLVILPVFTGKTIGKALTGLQVVQKDGRGLTFLSALLRHIIGYLLTFMTGGLGFLLCVFNSKGRALHDFLAGTVVVQASRRIVLKTQKK